MMVNDYFLHWNRELYLYETINCLVLIKQPIKFEFKFFRPAIRNNKSLF